MSDATHMSRWWRTISRRADEREVRRLVWYGHMRSALAGGAAFMDDFADWLPVIWRDFARMIVGALLAFWLIAYLLSAAAGVEPLSVYLLLALVFSAQSTYYKYRLAANPDYKIPKCRCAKTPPSVDAEKVLKSTQGELLSRVPNALLAAIFYALMLALAYGGHLFAVGSLALAACLFSAYLGYVMVSRIGSLCANCVNIGALNVLILCRLWV
jgi:uncharacterized membrane protein